MNSYIKNATLHLPLCLVLASCSTITPQDNVAPYQRDRTDTALKSCLNINYSAFGAYETKSLKDASSWTYDLFLNQKYTFDGQLALFDFVKKNTGDFHKKHISIKSESRKPPFNTIFAQCMEFYRSDELKEFIKNTPP